MLNIFRSRRFVSSLLATIAIFLGLLFPEVREHVDTVIPAIVVIWGTLAGGYIAEDFAVAIKTGERNPKYNVIETEEEIAS